VGGLVKKHGSKELTISVLLLLTPLPTDIPRVSNRKKALVFSSLPCTSRLLYILRGGLLTPTEVREFAASSCPSLVNSNGFFLNKIILIIFGSNEVFHHFSLFTIPADALRFPRFFKKGNQTERKQPIIGLLMQHVFSLQILPKRRTDNILQGY